MLVSNVEEDEVFFQKNVPYFVKLRVINCAGLSVVIESPPVFVDFTLPSPGVVKNGINFQSDRLWFYDPTFCQGKINILIIYSLAYNLDTNLLILTFASYVNS